MLKRTTAAFLDNSENVFQEQSKKQRLESITDECDIRVTETKEGRGSGNDMNNDEEKVGYKNKKQNTIGVTAEDKSGNLERNENVAQGNMKSSNDNSNSDNTGSDKEESSSDSQCDEDNKSNQKEWNNEEHEVSDNRSEGNKNENGSASDTDENTNTKNSMESKNESQNKENEESQPEPLNHPNGTNDDDNKANNTEKTEASNEKKEAEAKRLYELGHIKMNQKLVPSFARILKSMELRKSTKLRTKNILLYWEIEK
jgi:hypothetical protein